VHASGPINIAHPSLARHRHTSETTRGLVLLRGVFLRHALNLVTSFCCMPNMPDKRDLAAWHLPIACFASWLRGLVRWSKSYVLEEIFSKWSHEPWKTSAKSPSSFVRDKVVSSKQKRAVSIRWNWQDTRQ